MNETNIVNSFNIFIDSDRYLSPDSTGDDIRIPLNQTPISADNGQVMRISLQQFDMYKTWSYINSQNNTFRLTQLDDLHTEDGTTAISQEAIQIDSLNYFTLYDLATNFAKKLGNALSAHLGKALADVPFTSINQKSGDTQDSVNPDQNSVIGGTNDNIINFNINFGSALPDLIYPIVVQFMISDGDIYKILGGNRNRTAIGADLTTPSIDITYKYSLITNSASDTSIFVQCYYPASLSSESHIYLRCDQSNNNIQTESLLSLSTDIVGSTAMIPSRIIGKIPIDADICSYVSYKINEFF